MEKNCLILGGGGFIGSNFSKFLSQKGYKVVSIGRNVNWEFAQTLPDVQFIECKFEDEDEIFKHAKQSDCIIHLISSLSPRSSYKENLKGISVDLLQTSKLLEFLRINNPECSILYASSGGAVYGNCSNNKAKEEDILSPITYYGLIKINIEQMLIMYNRMYGTRHKIMRISNPYGEGQDINSGIGIINVLLQNYLNKKTTTIWGDGSAIKDYLYIDDLCSAVFDLIRYQGKEAIFNIGSGVGTSINEIIEIMSNILGEQLLIEYTKKKDTDISYIVLDTSKAENELGFKCLYDMEKGILKYSRLLRLAK